MMRPAPAVTAPSTAERPTPPRPNIATVWPGRIPAEYSAVPAPHITAQPNRLASTKDRSAGIFTTDFSDTSAYSAKADKPMSKRPRRFSLRGLSL